MNTIRKFRWFWPWDDEKEEVWLREMSGQGWHLKTVEPPGYYVFKRGLPLEYVYRLDFFTGRSDMANYQQLFEDAGWEYFGAKWGWQYFRHQLVRGKQQEIHTDNASKVQKYQRILVVLIILLPILLGAVFTFRVGAIPQFMTFLIVIFLLSWGYSMVRLLHRIGQLRAKN